MLVSPTKKKSTRRPRKAQTDAPLVASPAIASSYIDEGVRKSLKEINEKTCNGFFILFDIKDSTARKEEYGKVLKWAHQTEKVYVVFKKLCEDIENNGNLDLVVTKSLGDGFFGFFKSSDSKGTAINQTPAPGQANIVFEKSLRYREEIHAETELFGNMRLKSVITYLTDIAVIPLEKGNGDEKDALGRGIDFSFRLEKFADATHIVINEMMAKALGVDVAKKTSFHASGQDLFPIPVRKRLKGWQDPHGEQFFLLTSVGMIQEASDQVPSPFEQDVKTELFEFYIKNTPLPINDQEAEATIRTWGVSVEPEI